MKALDYVFYRVYRFYKTKKDSTPVSTACLVLSGVLVLTFISLVGFGSLFTKIDLSLFKLVIICILASLTITFWKRYQNKVLELEDRYRNEDESRKRRRGILIVLYIVLVLGIPVAIGVLRGDCGWDI